MANQILSVFIFFIFFDCRRLAKEKEEAAKRAAGESKFKYALADREQGIGNWSASSMGQSRKSKAQLQDKQAQAKRAAERAFLTVPAPGASNFSSNATSVKRKSTRKKRPATRWQTEEKKSTQQKDEPKEKRQRLPNGMNKEELAKAAAEAVNFLTRCGVSEPQAVKIAEGQWECEDVEEAGDSD